LPTCVEEEWQNILRLLEELHQGSDQPNETKDAARVVPTKKTPTKRNPIKDSLAQIMKLIMLPWSRKETEFWVLGFQNMKEMP